MSKIESVLLLVSKTITVGSSHRTWFETLRTPNCLLRSYYYACNKIAAKIFLHLHQLKGNIRQLKQPQRRRKRERHLKMSLCVSAIIFQLFKVMTFEKCVLTILELNWNQRLGHKKTKLNTCRHMLTPSTQLQNRSFDVIERTRTSRKCQRMKNARAKRAKILFFIVKYANLLVFVVVVVVVA